MSLVVPLEEIFANKTGLLANHDSWERINLGEVCTILNGFPFKSTLFNKLEGFPVIRIRDIARSSTETFYNGDFPQEYVVKKGDLLIGMDGNFRCCEWQGRDAGLNQRVCKIIPNERILHRKFLLYGLNGYLKAIEDVTSSVTVGHLSSRDVQRIPFPLPPLAEQRRIVAKLEALLGKVDASQQRLAKIPVLLKRFRQSVLAAACSGRLTANWREENPNVENAATRWGIKDAPIEDDNLPDLPATWVYRRLDDISERVSVTHVGPTSQYYCEKSEGVLFLRSQNVRPAKLDLAGSLYIRQSFHEAKKKSHLKPGDLLIVRVGANRGDTCILPAGLGEVNCANVIFARPLQGISEYLNIYFQTPFCQTNLQDLTTGSAQGVVNTKVVAGVPIALPPLPEQQEIVRRVEGLFALADQLEMRLAKARGQVDQLTPSLLARAFAGQLVPQDPTDEPATELLKRIGVVKISKRKDS